MDILIEILLGYLIYVVFTIPAMLLHFVFLAKLRDRFGYTWWVKFLILDYAWLDYVHNWVFSPIFLDLPRGPKELITGRFTRYKREFSRMATNNWRQRWQLWWAVNVCKFLSKHDAGHC